ncbi:MAG: EAL domain-containing protein [Idiomarina sp.]|nr:EAL domain-containing protein [Idiomarina sp.]
MYQKSTQNQFSTELLSHAELVSSQLLNAIRNAKDYSISDCSSESIDELRKIANQYLYVYDLGVVSENQIHCTANWGVFNPPPTLPDSYYAPSPDFQLYSQAAGIFPISQRFDISRWGTIAAFTVDFSFEHFLTRRNGFSYLIKTGDGEHEFLNYRPEESTTLLPTASGVKFFEVRTAHCSQAFGYCVSTENTRGGILYYSAPLIFALFVMSLGLGFVVTYAAQSYLYKKNSMEFRLRRAIQRKFMKVEYQPILQARTSKIIGVESLVRWRDPLYGNVSPELFIGIAENLGIYKDLTYHVAVSSIDEMKPVLKRNKDFFISLNVTSFEVLDDNYLLFLKRKVEGNGMHTRQVKIEITEKISVPLATLTKFSRQAKKYGFQVSLDDFGTGVANLVWLTEIAFDDIKIDRVFTQALNDSFKDKMVLSIMDMVTSLRKQVIFEGVETQGEFDVILNQFPTAYVQGWYFYRSLSKDSLFAVLPKHGVTVPNNK